MEDIYRKNNIAKIARDVAELLLLTIDAARHDDLRSKKIIKLRRKREEQAQGFWQSVKNFSQKKKKKQKPQMREREKGKIAKKYILLLSSGFYMYHKTVKLLAYI